VDLAMLAGPAAIDEARSECARPDTSVTPGLDAG
jgi:hypothetical protein